MNQIFFIVLIDYRWGLRKGKGNEKSTKPGEKSGAKVGRESQEKNPRMNLNFLLFLLIIVGAFVKVSTIKDSSSQESA